MEVTPSRPPAIPPRPVSNNELPAPPVPSRWDLCPKHSGNKFTAICTTCVRFLCRDCLLSEIYYHQKCTIAYLDDNILEACQQLHGSLNVKLDNVCQTVTDFHRSLSKKKERMLKKRNETMTEINRYFNRLKERLLAKLQDQEDQLLAVLNDKVKEQDTLITDKIQLCDKTLNNLEEKRAMLHNQARHSRRGGSPLSLLKNLVNTVTDLQNTEQKRKDIAAVRDAFLVIRFFVNSDNEQTILNSNIACVEVLNSRGNSQNQASLESERINEVSQNQEHSDTSRVNGTSSESAEIIDTNQFITNALHDVIGTHGSDSSSIISSTSELRVHLPPREDLNRQNDTRQDCESALGNNIERDEQAVENSENIGDNHEIDQESHSDEEDSLDNTEANEISPGESANDSIDPIPFETEQHSQETQEDDNELPPYNQQDASTDTSTENTTQDTSQNSDSAASTDTSINVIVTPPSDCNSNASSRQSSRPNSRPESRVSDREMNDRDLSDAAERSAASSPFPNRDDDPPPPYPGLPASPVQPGPDELPPPYPGGPPPPYSQTPEAQQPPSHGVQHRQRLHGESGRPVSGNGGGAMRRTGTDSDLLAMLREMPIMPPSQSHTPRLSRPKVGKTFSVNEANDRRVSGVFALAVVKDNAFLIVDRWNKKLKYFSSAGVSYGGLIFREEPWDITEITNDLVAVTVPQLNTLYKIKVTGNSVITTSTVPTPRMYACVSYSKNTEIFICGQVPQFGEPIIDVIGINGGEILQSFRTQFNMDQIRLSYPRYVKVDEEGTVIVCDWNLKCLTVFKLDGTMVGIYRGTIEFPLNEPSGIAYNQYTKEIFVIDAKHTSTQGAVHKLTKDCVCKEIIRFDNEFRIARAIAPHGSSYVLGNKSGVVSIFSRRQRR